MKVKFDNEIATIDNSVGNAFLGASDSLNQKAFSSNFGSGNDQSLTIYNWCDVTYAAGEPASTIVIKSTDKENGAIFTKRSGQSSFGSLKVTTATTSYDKIDLTMGLFGYNRADKGQVAFTRYDMTVFHCKIFDGGKIVRDYIPCIRNADNEVGLYDFVSQTFFISATGESFIVGNVAETKSNYRSYEDYFYDYDISYTTTKDFLLGEGSLTNPYIVKSTIAFLYLVENFSLAKKYLILDSNIILNEENFDENGTPSGGDGIIYSWKPIPNALNIVVDGKGYSVFGMYFNDASISGARLFSTDIASVKNLNMRNLFLKAKQYVAPIGANVAEMENCNTEGTIYATSFAGGLSIYVNKSIKNCNSYVNIYAHSSGGFVSVIPVNSNVVIEDSNNYGNVQGGNNPAGIVYYCGDGIHLRMENVNNYGNIVSTKNNTYSAGGLIAVIINKAKVELFYCGNYGIVYRSYNNDTAGGLVGQVTSNSCLTISQCKVYLNRQQTSCIGIVGYIGGAKDIIIQNSQLEIANALQMCLISSGGTCQNFIMKNCKIELTNGKGNSYRMFWSVPSKNTILDNVLIEADFDVSSGFEVAYTGKKSNITISGLVCILPQSISKSFYYGEDFSGFCTSWRTGKIDLRAMNGKDFFQGKVTQDWLLQEGFKKKAILL